MCAARGKTNHQSSKILIELYGYKVDGSIPKFESNGQVIVGVEMIMVTVLLEANETTLIFELVQIDYFRVGSLSSSIFLDSKNGFLELNRPSTT